MVSSYFFNGQTASVSIQLNRGPLHQVPGFRDPDPFVPLGFGPTPDQDVLGTEGRNTIVVTSTGIAQPVTWTVEMDGIQARGDDIQLLVFANELLARQDDRTDGFTITRNTG